MNVTVNYTEKDNNIKQKKPNHSLPDRPPEAQFMNGFIVIATWKQIHSVRLAYR